MHMRQHIKSSAQFGLADASIGGHISGTKLIQRYALLRTSGDASQADSKPQSPCRKIFTQHDGLPCNHCILAKTTRFSALKEVTILLSVLLYLQLKKLCGKDNLPGRKVGSSATQMQHL